MIEVEVFGVSRAREAPPSQEIQHLCTRAAARMGIEQGHVAVEFVDVERIAQLNVEHRGKAGPTDVLSFPIDGVEPAVGLERAGGRAAATEAVSCSRAAIREVPRELGDVVICPERTDDLREAIVHGMLHLLGMDHETDDGQMLAVQRELLAGADG